MRTVKVKLVVTMDRDYKFEFETEEIIEDDHDAEEAGREAGLVLRELSLGMSKGWSA